MIPSNLDPTHYTALQSLDFGNVLSLDGRAHPFDAMTPVSVDNVPATVVPAGTNTGPVVSLPADGTPSNVPSVSMADIASGLLPKHIGARLAVGFLAVAILIIVAIRFIL